MADYKWSAKVSAMRRTLLWATLLATLSSWTTLADDWPEFRGKGRLGVWNETGLLETFPDDGLPVLWRTPIKGGFTGPAVVNGQVFVTDLRITNQRTMEGFERTIALDERTGVVLWTQEWPVNYAESYVGLHAHGPAATPTVDGDKVYVLGRAGMFNALSTETGAIVWTKNFSKDYQTEIDGWGMASPPIIDGDRVISVVGGSGGAQIVAFDKHTGEERWRALTRGNSHGASPPIIIDAGGVRQLIIWDPDALISMNPETGDVYWQEPFTAYLGTNPAAPVHSGRYLLVSNFTFGSMMMELDATRPAAKVLWKGKGTSEIDTDGLHSLMSTPVIDGDYVYGICAYGQLRALDARTGERLWESQAVIERARYATALLVRNGDRYFINNDAGELILAQLKPDGYTEIDRVRLIAPTTNPSSRRKSKFVNWSHPAYANGHIYVRNDEEIVAYSLAADGL